MVSSYWAMNYIRHYVFFSINPLTPKCTKMCIFGLQLKIWKGFFKNLFLLKQLKIVKIDFLSNGATLKSVQPTGLSWLTINSRPIWPQKIFFRFFYCDWVKKNIFGALEQKLWVFRPSFESLFFWFSQNNLSRLKINGDWLPCKLETDFVA